MIIHQEEREEKMDKTKNEKLLNICSDSGISDAFGEEGKCIRYIDIE